MASHCPACLRQAIWRTRSFSTSTAIGSATAVNASSSTFSPVASTSKLPGSDTISPVRRKAPSSIEHDTTLNVYGETSPRSMIGSPINAPGKLASKLRTLFETRQAPLALDVYITELKRSPSIVTNDSLERLLNLFILYNQIPLAVEAIEATRRKGYDIPASLIKHIITNSSHDLITNPDKLAMLIDWVRVSLEPRDERSVLKTALDAEIATTLTFASMEALRRSGKSEWALGIFATYLESLPEGQVGEAKIWSEAIRCKAFERDLDGALNLFGRWRASCFEIGDGPTTTSIDVVKGPTTVSAEPYLVLLDFLAIETRNLPQHKDPAYKIIPLLHRDGLTLSTSVFNSLLRVELQRGRFSSFWGLYSKMLAGNWHRDQMTWRLLIQALIRPSLHRDSILKTRARKRKLSFRSHRPSPSAASPLQLEADYAPAEAPSPRQLFHSFLKAHKEATGHRPQASLSSTQSPVMSTLLLNTFIKLFVETRDWPSVAHVLETFKVYAVEPNAKTHGNVVVGIVKMWEKGRIRSGLLEGEAHSSGNVDWRDRQARLKVQLEEENGLGLIAKILKERNKKLEGMHRLEEEKQYGMMKMMGKRKTQIVKPEWMIEREMRDTAYLFDLLKKCAGADEKEWKRMMADAWVEISPGKKPSTGSQEPGKKELPQL